jgi:hypothetical protein
MRGVVKLAVLSALMSAGAWSVPVHAAGGSIWDHNGSKLTLEENGDKRKLVYKELREGLDKAGIRPGTVLFNGEKKPNGRLAGFAKIFKGTCNPVDYFVEGTFNERKGEIVLQGQAPVYASGTSCEVTGYSDSSPASTLSFTKIGDAPSAVVAGRAPDPQIEQGDGGVMDNGYLPPAPRGRAAARSPDAEQPAPPPPSGTAPRRGSNPDAQNRSGAAADTDEDDPDNRDYVRPRDPRYGRYPYYADDDRRYTRAPDPYQERSDRRRPDAPNPDEDMAPDEDDGYYDAYRRPVSPFWGRRYYRPW